MAGRLEKPGARHFVPGPSWGRPGARGVWVGCTVKPELLTCSACGRIPSIWLY
jgi:hypothetical protein